MRVFAFTLAFAGLTLAAIGTPVSAQSRIDRSEQQSRSRTSDQAEQQDQDTYSGTVNILRLKKVPIRNSDLNHSVALVRTDDGHQGVIDLGPADDLQELQLKSGQQIDVRGKSVRVGDRHVLMASRITSQGDALQIDRSQQPRERTRRVVMRSDLRDKSQQRQSRRAAVRGKVEQTKRVEVRDLGVDHLVVLVRTDNGKVRIVDLGPVDNLNRVRFARGDTIVADGNVVAVGDRQVLMARRVGSEDQQQDIQRDSAKKNRSNRTSAQRERNSRQRDQ